MIFHLEILVPHTVLAIICDQETKSLALIWSLCEVSIHKDVARLLFFKMWVAFDLLQKAYIKRLVHLYVWHLYMAHKTWHSKG